MSQDHPESARQVVAAYFLSFDGATACGSVVEPPWLRDRIPTAELLDTCQADRHADMDTVSVAPPVAGTRRGRPLGRSAARPRSRPLSLCAP